MNSGSLYLQTVILIGCGFYPHVYWEFFMLISSDVQVVGLFTGLHNGC